jgi:hypothetical protein
MLSCVLVDDAAVYIVGRSGDRLEEWSPVTGGCLRTFPLPTGLEPLAVAGDRILARRSTPAELVWLAKSTGLAERAFEVEPFESFALSRSGELAALAHRASPAQVSVEVRSLVDGRRLARIDAGPIQDPRGRETVRLALAPRCEFVAVGVESGDRTLVYSLPDTKLLADKPVKLIGVNSRDEVVARDAEHGLVLWFERDGRVVRRAAELDSGSEELAGDRRLVPIHLVKDGSPDGDLCGIDIHDALAGGVRERVRFHSDGWNLRVSRSGNRLAIIKYHPDPPRVVVWELPP